MGREVVPFRSPEKRKNARHWKSWKSWKSVLEIVLEIVPGTGNRFSLLRHIKDNYRNPIVHPEANLSEDEAEALFGVAASAMRLLVLESKALEAIPPSLDLDFGENANSSPSPD